MIQFREVLQTNPIDKKEAMLPHTIAGTDGSCVAPVIADGMVDALAGSGAVPEFQFLVTTWRPIA